jgi:flagellin-like protein
MGDGERMNRKNNKAISPVVATVIIVAIAIALAMAVALWASGLVGIFTRFEEVKIIAAYAEPDGGGGGFDISLSLRNTGSADATIDNVIINGKPFNAYTGITVKVDSVEIDPVGGTTATLFSGESKNMVITVTSGAGFKSGQTIDIKVHTSAGHEYAKAVVLP